jgi:hypothetical protein
MAETHGQQGFAVTLRFGLTLTPRDLKSADERATAESSVVHTGV